MVTAGCHLPHPQFQCRPLRCLECWNSAWACRVLCGCLRGGFFASCHMRESHMGGLCPKAHTWSALWGRLTSGQAARTAFRPHPQHPCPRAWRRLPPRPPPPGPLGSPAGKKLPRASGARGPDPVPCLPSEEPPLDLTGKVYQLEAMLKQLHTDLQKVSALLLHFLDAWGAGRAEAPVPHPYCSGEPTQL